MSILDRPPTFLIGAQRSGTSWLQRLLAAHPRVVSGQESHLFSAYLAPMWQRWQREETMRAEGGRTIGLGCYLTREQFVAQLRQFAAAVLGGLYGAKPGATLLLEKTPDHALHLPLIRTLFPDAPVIHLVRDGRDVVASLLAAGRQDWGRSWTPPTARQAAARWVHWLDAVRRDATPPFLQVRFEDLLADAPAVLRRVCDFLGLPLSRPEAEDICRRFEFAGCVAGTAAESLVLRGECAGAAAAEPPEFFRQGAAGAWRTDLAAEQQRAVEEVAGRWLTELGYREPDPAPEGPPPYFVTTVPGDDRLWASPERLQTINSPAQMLVREKLYLYATVFALAPERCLEVGVAQGWSSRIIADALRDLGRGRLVCVDPAPKLAFDPATLADVATLLVGPSPGLLRQAADRAGGLFDFVLLDGDHTAEGVRRDLRGLAEVTAPGCVVLVHDVFAPPVAEGIGQAVALGGWTDCGTVSMTCNSGVEGGRPATYAGFRLLVRQPPPPRLAERVGRVVRRGVARLRSLKPR